MSAEQNQVSSEFLKRTCLICGCHTNLTINIYEPRSGPNIVELIQAKFNFQPLNEDKYLCFSCNNWLINWHSLQAPNSNDAESPSHMNSSNSGNNMVHDNASCLPPQSPPTGKERPVATVCPRQLQTQEQQNQEPETMTYTTSDFNNFNNNNNESERLRSSAAYGKRRFRKGFQLKHCVNEHKMLRQCRVCGCAIVLRVSTSNSSSLNLARLKRSKQAQCRKCREISNWRALNMRSMAKSLSNRSLVQNATGISRKEILTTAIIHNNNNNNNNNNNISDESSNPENNDREINNQTNTNNEQLLVTSNSSSNTNQRYRQPRVDGKVVAMFRRLGTTLSREHETVSSLPPQHQQQPAEESHQPQTLPTIMSPAKQRPRWSRQLEDDEVLLEFNTTISEVLPVVSSSCLMQSQARRKLSYPITNNGSISHNNPNHNTSNKDNNDVDNGNEDHDDEDDVIEIQEVEPMASSVVVDFQDLRLPKGLSISLL